MAKQNVEREVQAIVAGIMPEDKEDWQKATAQEAIKNMKELITSSKQ